MSQRQFTMWHLLGLVAVLAIVTAAALAGGVFLGYQWGRATAVAAQAPNDTQAVRPSIPLPDLGPFSELLPEQPYLGLSYEKLTPELAETEGLSATEGALVRAVAPGSPAEAAGLQAGDVIQQVNGEPVDAGRDLREVVQALAPGDEVSLSVMRGEETLDLTATVGRRPAPVLPESFEQLVPGESWTLECAPPEPCRLVPGPSSPPAKPSEDNSLQGIEKQHVKPDARTQ
jgi:membrane-associated protease RseP (regulator of RpoE activity)